MEIVDIVDTVDIVDIVDTVDIVDIVDTVDTLDTVHTVDKGKVLVLSPPVLCTGYNLCASRRRTLRGLFLPKSPF